MLSEDSTTDASSLGHNKKAFQALSFSTRSNGIYRKNKMSDINCIQCLKAERNCASISLSSSLKKTIFLNSLRVKRNKLRRSDSLENISTKGHHTSVDANSSSVDDISQTLQNILLDKKAGVLRSASLGDIAEFLRSDAVHNGIFASLENEVQDSGGGNSYLYAPILPIDGSLIDAVVLSMWDNIVGPKATFVWTKCDVEESALSPPVEETSKSNIGFQAAIEYAVAHTLHGELDRSCISGNINSDLFIVADKGFVLGTVTFGAAYRHREHEIMPHSLTLVVPIHKLNHYLELQSLQNLWMERLAYRLRALLYKLERGEALAQFSTAIVGFCEVVASLESCGLQSSPSRETFLIQDSFMGQHFVEKAVTSHLQTCGCSLIVGESEDEVNTMVRTLALFLRPSERSLVRLADPNLRHPYHSGILVQGVLGDRLGAADIGTDEILLSLYPTTLVHVTNGQVLQSRLPPKHEIQRQRALHNEIEKVVYGRGVREMSRRSSTASSFSEYAFFSQTQATHSVFQSVGEAGQLVRTFFRDIRVAGGGWSPDGEEVAAFQFLRQLEYLALTLVQYMNLVCGIQHKNGNQDAVPSRSRRHLCKCLNLEDEGDFLIVLATAEKLKPGIFKAVMSMLP